MAEFRVLIVDDSPTMRHLLAAAVGRVRPLEIVEAENGLDALRKLSEASVDIVITDINMPVMDGLKLIRRIRDDPRHHDVPIVVVTTEVNEEDRRRAIGLGANAYVTKPIRAPQVVDIVRRLLGV